MYSLLRALMVVAVVALAAPSHADIIPGSCDQFTCRDDLVLRVSPQHLQLVQAQAPAPSTTVTTSEPTKTTISTGSWASDLAAWMVLVFGAPVGTLLTALLWKGFRFFGIQASDALRARFQEMIVNGLNLGAQEIKNHVAGKGQVEIKNEIVARTIEYVQDHGAETMKKLGIDPNSNVAVDAIKARIETAINDVNQPTPAMLDKPAS